ncbi:MAG: CDP-diacylglycerol--glycerol-3-phosphate 3-phosphatidyltransferase [Caldicoprobacter oshimai]|uniref:CDP-diacylglycerol--glycerol-3-phosphate 3-phosphatidyltransferase n=1 Tax=Caldicoprobacter faecalis TaxID=937334 RepID=A0A1I5XED8_9FIRM|nr:CDP-diacylglycerol--glycerol-3-phosphate 3-phosphatidyltransferase [Caldicoprobacter faecalis]PZN10536.1 MAG: CDP-diacylglycerol--glycerol-3-phosphate 3-phosphatidyltransferase [Caldicoprobacter oshimai]SFQ30339.1 cardiolipin synthase [Caldicoprobacter faecalis]
MNIPNILTVIRFCLIPVFIYVFYNPDIQNNVLWGIVVFIVAGATDLLDGYIARKYGLITKWGKLMDPLADKLMLITVLISLYVKGIIPAPIILIVFVKEFLMIAGAAFLYKNRNIVVEANFFGKAATASFYVAVVATVLKLPYYNILLYIAVVLTLIALVQYGYKAFKRNAVKR